MTAPAEIEQRVAAPRGVVRALAALGALGGLVIAVPVVLIALMRALPLDLGALSPAAWGSADDGRLLLLVIVAVAWVAWVVMVLSVGLETWSAVRRVPTPALPGLAVPQRWAAVLVTAVLVAVSPAAGSPAVGAPASLSDVVGMSAVVAAPSPGEDPVESEAPPEQAREVRVTRESLDQASGHPTQPTVSTERHDTLWMLAEQYLGAGERYIEIVDLNLGAQQPDGRSLGEDGRIYPGWTLALPADAVVDAERPARHRVVPGDTLWQIADEELGDPTRYPEIVEANRGDLQPDGQRLADPDLILPGWVLELPGGDQELAGRVAPTPADEGPADEGPAGEGPAGEGPADEGPADEGPADEDLAGDAPGASSEVTVPSSAEIAPIDRARLPTAASTSPPWGSTLPPEAATSDAGTPVLDRGTAGEGPGSEGSLGEPAATVPTSAPDPTPVVAADNDAAVPAVEGAAIALPAGGAVAALLLAGIGAELVRRRRQFQRHRRPGERMSSPGLGAQQVERASRTAGGETGPGLFERALVQLAEEAHAVGRPVPDVRLVRVSEESVVLDLAAPAGPAITPFVAADDSRWMLSRELLPAQMPDRSRALPGLVTLGFTGSETLLLNLESVGTLAVTGPELVTGDVLRGLAADLAFGPVSGLTERSLCVADATIAEAVEAGGIAVESDPARVAAALSAVLARPASRGSSADDPLLVVLCDQALGVTVPRGSGCALITAAPVEGAGATLVVHQAGTAVLLPEREHLTAQRLSAAATGDVVEALRLTDLPETAPSESMRSVGVRWAGALDMTREADGSRTLQTSLWDFPVPAPEVIDLREITSDPDRPALRHLDRAFEDPAPADPDMGPVSGVAHDAVPRVLLLGEVLVANAHGRCESTRIGRLAETTAFVLLNPGARPSELQGALWPGRRSNPQTCRQMISRARTWLGRTDSGEPYLMTFAESSGRLRLREEVGSDWADFQRLAEIGLADPEDTEHLTQALALVRGRPFGAVASRELPWADIHINEMISLITDVAHALALRHEDAGRPSAARDAALRGLRTESESEILEEIVARTFM